MTSAAVTPAAAVEAALARRFEAIVFDWDGTAVPDRRASAARVRRRVHELTRMGVEVVVVSGTHVGNVDGQLRARPRGPGRLLLCLNRGSEVFAVDVNGPSLVSRREATQAEERALSAAAEAVAVELERRGLAVAVVSDRLNRRKIDLLPEPRWADPPKAELPALVEAVQAVLRAGGIASLPEVVELARLEARRAGLEGASITSDAKHVEIGLTDKSHAAVQAWRLLDERGIRPDEVLIAGDEFGPLGGVPGSDSLMLVPELDAATVVSVGPEPLGVPEGVVALGGGPDAFDGILADQLDRRRQLELPAVSRDREWTIAVDHLEPELERADESLLALGDGLLGTRASPPFPHSAAAPGVFHAGAYAGDGPAQTLRPAPLWTEVAPRRRHPSALRRRLDLRTGVLEHDLPGELRCVAFSSLADPGAVALRADGAAFALPRTPPLRPPPGADDVSTGIAGGASWVLSGTPADGVAAIATDVRLELGHRRRVERVGVYSAHPPGAFAPRSAAQRLRRLQSRGFDALFAEHRAAWASRWEAADITIEGDDELQLAVRFALFHLMTSVADRGEAAVGARDLTGAAYSGHVFWDADVFVLPFLAATHPAAARAMLEYRLRRLDASRAAARAAGREGARFAWESARSGADVTPTHAHLPSGDVVRILTGEHEEHIVADVAWGAGAYVDWTGDRAFADGPGAELLVATARYWASRIRVDAGGRGHILGVVGPDEYHAPVDDNAYTNVMVRWNLRAAAAAGRRVPVAERRRWGRLANALVDGYDPETKLYEQFAGFYALEPLVIEDVAPRRPIAADMLFGAERVAGAQVVKQADVLMLHHLVPHEVAAGSLQPNLDYYEPRTSHGSSLSPGIHAALLARAGSLDRAVEYLRLTSRIDLDDITATAAGGLHLAAMGSVWQALVHGFAGVRPHGALLTVDPRLPEQWSALGLRVAFKGVPLRVRIEHDELAIESPSQVGIRLGPHRFTVGPGRTRFRRARGSWQKWKESE